MIIEKEGVKFDVDVRYDRDGRVDEMQVVLEGSDVELSDVLKESILRDLEEQAVREAPDGPDYEPEEPENLGG